MELSTAGQTIFLILTLLLFPRYIHIGQLSRTLKEATLLRQLQKTQVKTAFKAIERGAASCTVASATTGLCTGEFSLFLAYWVCL